MKPVKFSPTAERDLDGIFDYIARDSPSAAVAVLRTLRTRTSLLSRQPELGQLRDDLRPGLRCIGVGNYVVYFQPRSDLIDIVRVLHGARNESLAFEESGDPA